MNKVYEIVTEQILSLLDKGVIPWKQSWNCKTELPQNLVSGKAYQGINVWLLLSSYYASPYWLTFNQVQKLGGSIRKGEKSSIVVYWNLKEVKEVNETSGKPEVKKIPFLKYYRVFNLNQCEGIAHPESISADPIYPIQEAERIIDGYADSPEIKHGFTRASYNSGTDIVKMPDKSAFSSVEEYYATLFHELTHSTGHKSRLDRDTLMKHASFGSKEYSREELIAEMGAAFLCGLTGIAQATIENSAAYIQSWRQIINNDPKLVVLAAAQAQKAVNHICGQKIAEGIENDETQG